MGAAPVPSLGIPIRRVGFPSGTVELPLPPYVPPSSNSDTQPATVFIQSVTHRALCVNIQPLDFIFRRIGKLLCAKRQENMLSLFGQHAFQIFFQEKEAPIVGQ
jgi:hypothetical protein